MCYVVIHFGGKHSAYWWHRFSAWLHRLSHMWLRVDHAGWVYSDDSLFKLLRRGAPFLAVQLLLLWLALGVPVAWKKVLFGEEIDWVGYLVS